MPDKPLSLQLHEHAERFRDRARLGAGQSADTKVHDVEHVKAEMLEIVVNGLAQLLWGQRSRPTTVRVSERSDFRYDVQVGGIGMQRLPNDLIGYVRPVKVARIDVRDAEGDSLAQHRYGSVSIARRPEHVRAGELHRAISHAGDRQILGQRKRSAGERRVT